MVAAGGGRVGAFAGVGALAALVVAVVVVVTVGAGR